MEHVTRTRDHGFTLIEILVAIVLAGVLSAVVVVGVGALQDSGTRAACAASSDGASAAVRAAYVHDGHYPASVADLVGSGALVLADELVVSADGMAVEGDQWELRMTPGAPPTFACRDVDPVSSSTTVVPATAPATTVPAGPVVRVCVRDAAGTLVGGAEVHTYAGTWRRVDVTVAGACVDAGDVSALTHVAVSLRGVWRQLAVGEVPVDGDGNRTATFTTAPRYVRVVDSAGRGVSGAGVQFYAGSWQEVGTTGADGCASVELLPSAVWFGVTHRGVWNQVEVPVDAASCTTATTFATAPRFVRVVRDLLALPVAGVTVEFYAGSWQAVGTTGADGCVSVELLPTVLPVGASWRGVWRQAEVNLWAQPSLSCATAVLVLFV